MRKMLLLIILASLSSCELFYNYYVNFDKDQFDEQKALWEQSSISNYNFTQQFSSMHTGAQPHIVVQHRQGVSPTIYLREEDPQNDVERFFYFETVDELYTYIETCYLENKPRVDDKEILGLNIEIEYDLDSHIPIYCHLDIDYKDSVLGGLNTSVRISDYSDVIPPE